MRQGGSSGRVKHAKLLSEGEFRERFGILNGVYIQLLEGDVVPTNKSKDNSITVQRGTPSSAPLSLQAVSPLHENSSGFDSSQRGPSADGPQHSGYAIQLGPILVGGPLCLHHQEGEE